MNIPDYAIHNDKEISGFFGDYRFLSNFWPARICYATSSYPTVEHAFVAAKNVNGLLVQAEIDKINLMTAGEVKRYGRTIKLREDWQEVKTDIMAALVFDKFWRYNGKNGTDNLRQKLLDTGDRALIESNNWHDNVWGSCVCPDCEFKSHYNQLGKIFNESAGVLANSGLT